jgi:hypothetical protein
MSTVEPIKVSREVLDGLESVRKGGKTNMLDVDMVIILSQYLAIWLQAIG